MYQSVEKGSQAAALIKNAAEQKALYRANCGSTLATERLCLRAFSSVPVKMSASPSATVCARQYADTGVDAIASFVIVLVPS